MITNGKLQLKDAIVLEGASYGEATSLGFGVENAAKLISFLTGFPIKRIIASPSNFMQAQIAAASVLHDEMRIYGFYQKEDLSDMTAMLMVKGNDLEASNWKQWAASQFSLHGKTINVRQFWKSECKNFAHYMEDDDNIVPMQVHAGADIARTLSTAITYAQVSYLRYVKNGMLDDVVVLFDFNGVAVKVKKDSDGELIMRDWRRALSGYIAEKVGPYPSKKLSEAELAKDAEIEAKNEARRAKSQAKYDAEVKAKHETLKAKLQNCPEMERDEDKWQEGVTAQDDHFYGLAVFTFAEYWARLMQFEIDAGKALVDIAEEASQLADVDGITGFMYGAAVTVLAQTWVHGEDLRKWHNKQYGVPEDKEGVVNPAIITISSAA